MSEITGKLTAAYDKVKEWPENSETGFMDLITLRNLVPEAVSELNRLREALIASRNSHAELAEFLLGDGGSAVKSDVLKGMFADLQRARLAADAALEPRS